MKMFFLFYISIRAKGKILKCLALPVRRGVKKDILDKIDLRMNLLVVMEKWNIKAVSKASRNVSIARPCYNSLSTYRGAFNEALEAKILK